ncbi:MAG: ABC-F family ATP-binding cassette domain-containing protein [Chloroflexi bacterium]|nr:ABC-F family ATP-binding cassette domain-containing protein [Chloroflexota bacterium]
MSILTVSKLGKFYGPEEIFSDISAAIPVGARIALVGPNGAGKTTLLNLLAGVDAPTSGSVSIAGGARLSFLPQRPELAGEHSLWREQLKAFADLRAMQSRLAELEGAMADANAADGALDAYGRLQAEFERLGGYEYETKIRIALSGLGFRPAEYDKPLPQLSGGDKTRAALSRRLLEEPDLLILDEPTNHLDIQAVEWLEKFLASFPGAVLAVSHDRTFIDNFAATVWEIEYGRLQIYRGNYSAYRKQRASNRETLRHDYYWQQQFIRKEEAFIRRHMGSRGTAQAKGRLKKLETMKKRGLILEAGPRRHKKMFLEMNDHMRSGDQAIVTRDLQIGYDSANPLLGTPDLLVLRGETVAIIGRNGVGKTTLLKTLSGDLPTLAGEVSLGAKVKIGYFAQAQSTLNAASAIIDEIRAVKPLPLSQARDWLGRFLFSGDDVFRPISSLSGGERGRVALAKLALEGASLLLLDEPTNHLDIDSQEVLEAALARFGGTILLVSHDRYLVDNLATQIWEVKPGEMTVIDGDYQEYLRQRNRALQQESKAKEANSQNRHGKRPALYRDKKHGLNPFELAKHTAALEEKIQTLETSLHEISLQLDDASLAGDANAVRQLGLDYANTEAKLEAALEEWGRFVG